MKEKLVWKLDGEVIAESTPSAIPIATETFVTYCTEPPLISLPEMTKKEWAMEFVKFKIKTYLYDPRFKKATLLEYKEGDSIILTSFTGEGFIFDHKLINLSWAWAYFNDQSYEITEDEFFAHILAHLNSLQITDKKFVLI